MIPDPDPKEIFNKLSKARDLKARAHQALFAATERVGQLKAEIQNFLRKYDPKNIAHQERLQLLEQKLGSAGQAENRQERIYKRVQSWEKAAFQQFIPFSDPIQNISNLDAHLPFFLMPLRIETRFRLDLGEFWVRVFPDECMVDSFEPTLSETEVRNAQVFWLGMWAAGGDEAQEKAAWRSLVSSHGSGRAAWIINNYKPLDDSNGNLKPTKADSNDVILVIPTDLKPDEKYMEALSAYWRAIWLADGDLVQEANAVAALGSVVGESLVTELIKRYVPFNLGEVPLGNKKKGDVNSKVVFIFFRPPDQQPTKRSSWSQPARVDVLPDRLVLLGYVNGEKVFEKVGMPIPSPLHVSPDPMGTTGGEIKAENGDLAFGENIRWMVDFHRSIEWGLGFKIVQMDLKSDVLLENGFDQLFVLGVRLSADDQRGKALVETLFQHHHDGTRGFSLLPHGTPTNNTESSSAGFTRVEDADETFRLYLKPEPPDSNLPSATDGRTLAKALGFDKDFFKKTLHGDGTDQLAARAMNTALFPGTLGYMLTTMLKPALALETIQSVRAFFTQFVSGRGSVPAIRIGKQPYGILPTTVFSSSAPFEMQATFLKEMHTVVRTAHTWWQEMAKGVDYVGKQGDPHQILLSVLGLHPTSVEYHSRHAQSEGHLYNLLTLQGSGKDILQTLHKGLNNEDVQEVDNALKVLRDLGYHGEAIPDILKLIFWNNAQHLKGPVIDDRPLSETEKIRPYTEDGRNYLEWLADSARESLDRLRTQSGFIGNSPPTSLLYILMRYSLMNTFWETGMRMQVAAKMLSTEDFEAKRNEPPFVHIRQADSSSESRWADLYKDYRKPDGNLIPIWQLVAQSAAIARSGPMVQVPPSTNFDELSTQLAAIEFLQSLSTARLERLFAEHLDCCSYRLDAWELGLVNYQLSTLRSQKPTGLYLGAYGWLENVRPKNSTLTPVKLGEDLDPVFNPPSTSGKPDLSPLMQDDRNGGYVHAPSLNQAVTAAVLRNGYLANATSENPQTLAVNLSSERVRLALSFIEGIRNGQSLGALLGYQLERGLHDRHNLAEVDEFIFKLRKEFPLRAKQLKLEVESTDDAPDADSASIEALEARNVIDGLSLIEQVKNPQNRTYPFGKPLPLDVPQEQEDAINAEVDRMLDIHDALADLALAESVHQIVQGNHDRATATLDAYGKSSFPPMPDVIQTPRSGVTLTHRVGLQLEAGLDLNSPNSNPLPQIHMTPRAKAEPALNKWLASVLPDPSSLVCQVAFIDPRSGADVQPPMTCSWRNLELQPIDILYLVRLENEQAMSELDDRVIRFVMTKTDANTPPRPDARIQILYAKAVPSKITFFEVAPLVQSLRALVLDSSPLKASDIMLTNQSSLEQEAAVHVDSTRINNVLSDMTALHGDLTTFVSGLNAVLGGIHSLKQEQTNLQNEKKVESTTLGRLDEIITRLAVIESELVAKMATLNLNIDSYITQMVNLLERASTFSIPQTGWGFAYAWKSEQYAMIIEQAQRLSARWHDRLAEFDSLIDMYDHLPQTASDEERYQLLQRAELMLSVQLAPHPDSPEVLRTSLKSDDLSTNTKHKTFTAKQASLDALLSTTTDSLSRLLADFNDWLPISALDAVTTETDEIKRIETTIITFVSDLLHIAEGVASQARKRINNAQQKFDESNASASASVGAKAMQEAASLLLGEDFHIIPEFALTPEHGNEWTKSFDTSHDLLNYLNSDFPVDDWLYGIARVREKMGHWERLLMLAGAMGRMEPDLTPIQLPYQAGDRWVAMEFPQDNTFSIDGDRLLYTAHYANGFNKLRNQCGLLLDVWTEVVPGNEDATGLAFHFDRPNAEPPQTLLLALSPKSTNSRIGGKWDWQDLVDVLRETLELAKIRAVEPSQVDSTALNRLLPASLPAFTLREVSISANLSFNNKIMEKLP